MTLAGARSVVAAARRRSPQLSKLGRVVVALLVLLGSGCDSRAVLEPTPLAEGVFSIGVPTPPLPAALPVLEPCPTGWSLAATTVVGGAATCVPWAGDAPATCPAGEVRFVGEAACHLLGSECPTGDFAEGLQATGVRYVNPDAGPGGDGSRARPVRTIAAAFAGAPAGTMVALARGVYDSEVRIPQGVTVRGACVAETVLAPATPHDVLPVVTPLGPGARLENVTVRGSRPGVIAGVRGASITLEDVEIANVQGFAVEAFSGNSVTLRRVSIHDVAPLGAREGLGLFAEGEIVATSVSIHSVAGVGLRASGEGSLIDASDISVSRGLPVPGGLRGQALSAVDLSRISLRRFALDGNRDVAVYVQTGGDVSLSDGVIRGTVPRTQDQARGYGVLVLGPGNARLSRVALSGNHGSSVYAQDRGAVVHLEDVVADDTRNGPIAEETGFGLIACVGAKLQLRRVSVQRSRGYGIAVYDPGSSVEGSDVTVLETHGRDADGKAGTGLAVARAGVVTAARVHLARNRGSGFAVSDVASVVSLEDLLASDTQAGSDPRATSGGRVQLQARLTLRRAEFVANEFLGLVAISATVDAEDLTVRDTRGSSVDGFMGRGLHLQDGARGTVLRGRFDGNREVAASVSGEGSALRLEDVAVGPTLEPACVPRCPGESGGGLAAFSGGHVSATRFFLRGNPGCGLHQEQGGTADLKNGYVVGNLIGLCIADPAYDLSRVSGGVNFAGNQTKTSAAFLPLPDFKVVPTAP